MSPNAIKDHAAQLIPILAMWGISREDARRVFANAATMCAGLSEKDYVTLKAGLHIRPPSDPAAFNDNASPQE